MNGWRRIAAATLCVAGLAACSGGEAADPVGADSYTIQPASAGGTGRIYRGREIAAVMSHAGAAWLDRDEREQQERTDLVLERLPIDAHSVVADIGAGSGYFTLPMAARAAAGRVYAVDVQPEMLAAIVARATGAGLTNIVPVEGTATDPKLPANALDLVLMVDAYHEFSHPQEMLDALLGALKPGGRAVVVEYRGEDPRLPIHRLHKMTEQQVRAEFEGAGFEWIETGAFLPQQHYLVFRRPWNAI